MKDEKSELWAIVELFGHNRISGKVSEHNIGSGAFIRIDVPDTKTVPAWSRLLNPSAIYAINPVTEEVARASAESISAKPLDAWDAREMLRRIESIQKQNAPQLDGIRDDGSIDEDLDSEHE